jgi:protein SCO1/2
MMNMKFIIKLLMTVSVLFASMALMAVELPDNSIYHVDSNWTNQSNETVNIASLNGNVQVVAFVYTYCEHSCPIILAKLQLIEKSISPEQKDDIRFLLISLDPERDTPTVLNHYMIEKDLDVAHWQMFSGKPDDVLELSALLGVRYKPMNNDAKDISHSNMITVLDKKGRIHYQMKGLDASFEQVVAEISAAAK